MLFQFCTVRFDLSNVLGGGKLGLPLKQQIISGKTGTNVDQIAQTAETINCFKQDDFHRNYLNRYSGEQPPSKVYPGICQPGEGQQNHCIRYKKHQ